MPALYAGIDGGQSSTIAVVLDARGTVLGRGTAGPSDHVDEPKNTQRAAQACESALAAALAAANLPPDTEPAAVVIGLSGYEGDWYGREPVFGQAIVRYKHDSVIALAGAIRERPAAVVIAGTGSVAYGESAQRDPVRAGGFGYLFGDEGSSFAIARTALAAAMRLSDRGVLTDLGLAALAFFDCPDLRALARAVALREIGRPQVASFCPGRLRCRSARRPGSGQDRRGRGGGAGRPRPAGRRAARARRHAGRAGRVRRRRDGQSPSCGSRPRGGWKPGPPWPAWSRRRSSRRSARRSWPSMPPGSRGRRYDPRTAARADRLDPARAGIRPQPPRRSWPCWRGPRSPTARRASGSRARSGSRRSGPRSTFRSSASLNEAIRASPPTSRRPRDEIDAIVAAGAEIVAFDATPRARPHGDDVRRHGRPDSRPRRRRDGRLRHRRRGARGRGRRCGDRRHHALRLHRRHPRPRRCPRSTCCARPWRPGRSRSSRAAWRCPMRWPPRSPPAPGPLWSGPR